MTTRHSMFASSYRSFLSLLMLGSAVALVGCGGGSSSETPSTPDNTPEKVEKILSRASNTSCLAPAAKGDTASLLSGTGCFTGATTQTPTPGVVPYTVNSLLWSDGEKKGRYFAIPDGTTIDLNIDASFIVATNGIENGNFDFPVGSVILKHFFNGSRIVETRLLMNHANDGWAGYAYEWNAAQTDASLLTAEKQITSPVSHFFPSPEHCMECHTDAAQVALGPDTLQLNYTLHYTDDTTENYLDALNRLGYLSAPPLAAYKQDRLYAIDDTSATLEQRARSYLHSNCSGCHRAGVQGQPGKVSPGGVGDMRYNSSFAATEQNVCGIDPQVPESPGDALIEPGDAAKSTLFLRINDAGDIRMPPIGRATIDQPAAQLIKDWINSLAACE